MIKLKRVYDKSGWDGTYTILVDRLWPRGILKTGAPFDLWLKEIAPTTELRKWFDHDPVKWEEFQLKYIEELKSNTSPVKKLKEIYNNNNNNIVLTYAARDIQHNHAVLLKKLLESDSL